jgi:predicted transcriptional regulator
MDIKLDPELERLLTQSAEAAGREPSALLDEIVRKHLARKLVESEVLPAIEEHLRGESKVFDRETFLRDQKERIRGESDRADP